MSHRCQKTERGRPCGRPPLVKVYGVTPRSCLRGLGGDATFGTHFVASPPSTATLSCHTRPPVVYVSGRGYPARHVRQHPGGSGWLRQRRADSAVRRIARRALLVQGDPGAGHDERRGDHGQHGEHGHAGRHDARPSIPSRSLRRRRRRRRATWRSSPTACARTASTSSTSSPTARPPTRCSPAPGT